MKKIVLFVLAGMALGLACSGTTVAEEQSLRGSRPPDKLSRMFKLKKQIKKEGGFKRAFKQAPPQIPHDISKDRITLTENTCMKCHSAANYKREKAPKAGDSHFKSRDGKVLKEISTRRYFCVQCHVPQLDAQPLVENTFKGVPADK